ncbi:MAG TPA: glycoside hydrolase family 99-like domain-containing protein [Candidatus Eisenbergiella merdipullorum]|uniref:Glycoside hydrolase family 99-like domain-containing protein n=1 Tax=Candidatus Eisenbergiella merdipullorum TaxID=2838553 RepID=A0A9D2I5P5_9FIRM|nr:glycoside hydrolase family 99-like domain-containing protein [Candidatus Eisenbergiella merdipullorum]
MKIIAFYLPQFHEIEENNIWWGEGFTEWTNVKKAIPLYKGHRQPRIPYKAFYYNLLDLQTLKYQAKLAGEYGISGFCYYHYWFNGKLLLEKPVELLLKNEDIDIQFCFCWANEPWTRSWDGKNRKIIMPQQYGGMEDWEKHFNYLLPYFKDHRYIKMDNCPMFILYKSEDIKQCGQMIDFFNRRCREYGFNGIYIAEEINGSQKKPVYQNSRAVVEFEPSYVINDYNNVALMLVKAIREIRKNIFHRPIFFSYDRLWKKILKEKLEFSNKQIFFGAFVDWDNTPRRGKKATVVRGYSREKFERYMRLLIKKAEEKGGEYLFINAWNEWAEGAYLEPDECWGFQKLSIIKKVLAEIQKEELN